MVPFVMNGRQLPSCLYVVPGTTEPYLPLPGCRLITVRDSLAPATLEGCVVELTLHAEQREGREPLVTVQGRTVLERPGHGH